MNDMLIGCFCSISGGMPNAVAYEAAPAKANAMMVYTESPRKTERLSIEEFENKARPLDGLKEMQLFGIKDLTVHAPYIINPASPELGKYILTYETIFDEMVKTRILGSKKLVLHPGNYTTSTKSQGLRRCIETLEKALEKYCNSGDDRIDDGVTICLETMAGKGTEIGTTLNNLQEIIKGIVPKYQHKLGVCLDTCHMHDAGYDLSHTDILLEAIDNTVGLDCVKVIHLNDSFNPRGSRKDRHEDIGKGTIGIDTLHKIATLPEFKSIPKILETPSSNYRYEIELLRNYKPTTLKQ